MMSRTRTQIYLAPEEHRAARKRAAELGVSLAEYIRRLVRHDLGEQPGSAGDVAALFALGDSGGSDVAALKDRYVGEVVANEPRRR